MERSGMGAYNPNSEKPKEFLSDWSKSDETLLERREQDIAKLKDRIISVLNNPQIDKPHYVASDEVIRTVKRELINDGYSEDDVVKGLYNVTPPANRSMR